MQRHDRYRPKGISCVLKRLGSGCSIDNNIVESFGTTMIL